MTTKHSHCPKCGLAFKAFRSGHTFASVAPELYPEQTKADWLKHYTRKTILNELKARKAAAWRQHMEDCPEGSIQ